MKKKLLVEWKIGTFGVYNLTTTTSTTSETSAAVREKNRKLGSQNKKYK